MEQAITLDAKYGNTLWANAIFKDFKSVNMPFKIYQMGQRRLVARDHMNKASTTISYTSVVSRKTIKIALMIATHNDPEVN